MKLYHDDMVKLKEMFGHRVKFDDAELRLYSQDISNPPAPVRMMIKNTPDAVVLPKDTDDLVALVRFANEKRVPLVPRGGGSAGYGGAMPVKGGIVVDMSHLTEGLRLVSGGKLAEVPAGMTWLDADLALGRSGKAVRIMPTSAPMATVGGWVAQGGAGIGSLRYGWIQDVVQALEVVLPNGEVRHLAGSELDVVFDMEGTTGFITKVVMKVRDANELVPLVATYKDLAELQSGVDRLRTETQLHTILVHNPEFNELRQESTGLKNIPKGQFSLVMALEKGGDQNQVKEIVEATGGKLLPPPKAASEWDQRFALFRAKRLGPSMVPGESVVPTKRLAASIAAIRDAVKADELCMEGIVAGDQTIWFCFALDDERRAQFPAAFGAGIAVLHASKGVGGRTLGTGVYLSNEARRIFDDSRIERYAQLKKAVDPHGIMNPGKVFGAPIRFKPDWAPGPSLADALAPGNPILRRAHGSSWVKYNRPERGRSAYTAGLSAALGAGSGGAFGRRWAWDLIAGDVDRSIRWASASARTFRHLGASPAGWATWAKDHAIGNKRVTAHQWAMLHGEGLAAGADLASTLGLPWSRIFQDLKTHLVEQGFLAPRPLRDMAEALQRTGNVYGEPKETRAAWAEGLDLTAKGTTLLYVDDFVSYRRPETARATAEALAAAGHKLAYLGVDETGSASILLHTGQREAALPIIEANIKAITKTGAKELVTPDSITYHVLTHDYAVIAEELGLPWTIKVRHASEPLLEAIGADKVDAPALDGNVAVHDVPVLLVNGLDGKPLRDALKKAGAKPVEMVHHGAHTVDLGISGGLPEAFPEIPRKAAEARLHEAIGADANLMLTACPASAALLEAAAARLDGETETPMPKILDVATWLAQPKTKAADSADADTATAPEGDADGDDAAHETETTEAATA